MLEDGELVRVFAGIVQEPLDEPRGNPDIEERERGLNCLPALVAGEARDEVLAAVQGLGQAGELRALAEVFRAHGEDDVERDAEGISGFKERGNEEGRLIATVVDVALGLVADQLLELIHDKQKTLAGRETGRASHADQPRLLAVRLCEAWPGRRRAHPLRKGLSELIERRVAGRITAMRQREVAPTRKPR
jgi:hypothetical protein